MDSGRQAGRHRTQLTVSRSAADPGGLHSQASPARIVAGELTLRQLRACREHPEQAIALDDACRPGIRSSAAVVQRATVADAPVYGVNTGFGKLATQRIAKDDL